jgi:hypothetical protein
VTKPKVKPPKKTTKPTTSEKKKRAPGAGRPRRGKYGGPEAYQGIPKGDARYKKITTQEDPETPYDASADELLKDHVSKYYLQFPPPRGSLAFRKLWLEHIEIIASRGNFKTIFLGWLKMLCDAHIEYERLSQFIRVHGETYESGGRNGYVVRVYPQVAARNKVKTDIMVYSRRLGIDAGKDQSVVPPKEKQSEWA